MWDEVSISVATADFDFSVIGSLPKLHAYRADEKGSRSLAAKGAAQDDKGITASRLHAPNIAESWPMAFSVHSPERTQAEPGKRQREANGDGQPAGCRPPGGVLRVLTDERDSAESRHGQKDSASHLKP